MLRAERLLQPGETLRNWSPGFHVRRVVIDNPSGYWLRINDAEWLPPYTFGFDRSYDVGFTTLTIVPTTTGPTNITSGGGGSTVSVTVLDLAAPSSSPGYTVLGPGAITGDLIASATITAANIAAATITAAEIADGSITGQKIANATITGQKIANATITGANIASATITGSHIQDGSITAAEIANATITGANIASATITGTNIASATITGSNIASLTIQTGNLGDLVITTPKLANQAVTGPKIANGAVDTAQLAATATIKNVTNGPATVTIDSTGLTVTDGAITLADQFGVNVLTGQGWGRPWTAYSWYGFYNATFENGSTSDIPVSEVNGGNSALDYANSLSPNLPYWVVAASGGTLARVADSTSIGGTVLRSTVSAGQTNRVYQDIPVIPGRRRTLFRRYKVTLVAAGQVTVRAYYSYRDVNHVLIGTRTSLGSNIHTAGAASFEQIYVPLNMAPTNAAYVRFELEVTGDSGTFQVNDEAVWTPLDADPKFRTIAADEIRGQSSSTVFVKQADLSVDNDISAGGDLFVSGPGGIFMTDGMQLQRVTTGLVQMIGSMLHKGIGRMLSLASYLMASGTTGKVPFDTTIWAGPQTSYNSTNRTIVVSRAGLYLLHLEISFPARSDYTRFILGIGTAANGGNPTASDADGENTHNPVSTSYAYHIKREWVRWLDANDAVAFFVHQTNSGGAAVTATNIKGAVVYLGGMP